VNIYKVDSWNNFCRVFKCPKVYSPNYCVGGGISTIFTMVDWFNPVCDKNLYTPAISKEEWIEKGIEKIVEVEVDSNRLKSDLTEFLLGKNYIEKNNKYIVICNFGFTFSFDT